MEKIFTCQRGHMDDVGYHRANERYFCRVCKNLRERKAQKLKRIERIQMELIWDRDSFEKEDYYYIKNWNGERNENDSPTRAERFIREKEEYLEQLIYETEDICIELEKF